MSDETITDADMDNAAIMLLLTVPLPLAADSARERVIRLARLGAAVEAMPPGWGLTRYSHSPQWELTDIIGVTNYKADSIEDCFKKCPL